MRSKLLLSPAPRAVRAGRLLPTVLGSLLLAVGASAQDAVDPELLREIGRARKSEATELERRAAREREAESAERRAREAQEGEDLSRSEALQRELEAALATQSRLVDRKRESEVPSGEGGRQRWLQLGAASLPAVGRDTAERPGAGLEGADPRIAPRAPVDRDLPAAIFEERPVTIAAGTWGNRRALSLRERVLDADGDGFPELTRWVEKGSERMVRQAEDRNLDGITDAWSDYAKGSDGRHGIVARALDSNDDGNPDVWETYREGRLSRHEIDRDDDGVRDAFFRYEGDDLVEERHDADNDGRIDLRIHYRDRRPHSAEEDRDRDGRMDLWTRYVVAGERELVSRVERDDAGSGSPDVFERFEVVEGRAVLTRREEDRDGDGEIDVLSIYSGGKLVRREIARSELL